MVSKVSAKRGRVPFGFFHLHRGFSPVISWCSDLISRFNGFYRLVAAKPLKRLAIAGPLTGHRAEATV
jgi:hypothetical protein